MRDLSAFAERLAATFDIGAVTFHLCDHTSETFRLVQLLNVKVPGDAGWTYQSNRIFVEDPFTNTELNEAPDIACSDAVIPASDARIQDRRDRCQSYWSFLDHFGLIVEGVSTRRVRKGAYTSIGFLRRSTVSYADALSLPALNEVCGALHNMMAALVLDRTTQTNAGLMALQRLCDPANDDSEQSGDRMLSRREREVSEMVGMGLQSKEVAFRLHLSEHTVENHLRSIYSKLGIHNRASLARLMY